MSKNKVALLTGAGMDSKTLAHILIEKNYTIYIGYRPSTLWDEEEIRNLYFWDLRENPNAELNFIPLDITDRLSIEECIKSILNQKTKIDEFYHLAGVSSVIDSFKNPELVLNTNGQSVYHILDSLYHLSKNTKFFFAGTSEVFDKKQEFINENSKLNPSSPYAVSKLLGIHWCEYFRSVHGMFCAVAYLFGHSNYYRHSSFFFMRVCKAALEVAYFNPKYKLKVGNIDFYRDEGFADFYMEAAWKMLQLSESEDFVLGNGELNCGKDYLELAFLRYGLDYRNHIEIDNSLIRSNDNFRMMANTEKAQKFLGWKNKRIDLKTHIGLVCEYVFNRMEGERPIVRPKVFNMF